MWAARFYLLGPGLHKKEKGSWALTLISLYASSLWKQYDQLPQVAAIWLPHCSVLDPWTVNQSKHFFSQVALVREILSRSQGKQLIYCVFYSPSYKSDFSQMQICIWQSLCQEKPQCLRLSRMSGASDLLWSPEVSPVNICLAPSGLQTTEPPVLCLFYCPLVQNVFSVWRTGSSCFSLSPPLCLCGLTFICLLDLQLDVTLLTRAISCNSRSCMGCPTISHDTFYKLLQALWLCTILAH